MGTSLERRIRVSIQSTIITLFVGNGEKCSSTCHCPNIAWQLSARSTINMYQTRVRSGMGFQMEFTNSNQSLHIRILTAPTRHLQYIYVNRFWLERNRALRFLFRWHSLNTHLKTDWNYNWNIKFISHYYR